MEIKQLEYFLVLSQELHFTRAAEKLNISQPSLSQQIKILESKIGLPLFDRIGKRIRITEAGEILLKHCHNIFFELKQIHSSVDDLRDLEIGQVSIGGLLSVVSYLLPSVIIRYHELYPKIKLSIKGLKSDDIYDQLVRGDLDLGILIQDEKNKHIKGLKSIPLYTEKLALAVPINHELADIEFASLDILKNTSNILFPKDYFTRQLLDRHCKSLGFELSSFLEMVNMESMVTMVEKGAGVTVLPVLYLELKKLDNIKIIPLVNFPPIREIRIFYSSDKLMTRATKAFLNKLIFSIENNLVNLDNINKL